ncbi:3300_t:CDS:2 [Racocetra persica]|uniref:3300_t:CDS:1 n=1 Tax=Racocetra persica TaxID=160502 RepID=A0ACA9L153_9GLOM|nr:3300_t:CDS:2 [Racocetra persica]
MLFEHEGIIKAKQTIYNTYNTSKHNKSAEETPKFGSLQDYFWKRSYNIFVDNNDSLKEYLNLPIKETTSVASEQMFSIAKFTISPTKNQIDPEKACAALCLKTWYAAGLIKHIKDN